MSKFYPQSEYSSHKTKGYSLLPFNFNQLDSNSYILTNMVGEYVLLDRKDLNLFVGHELHHESDSYKELESRHFLQSQESTLPIELLALKTRTKLARLSNFTSLHMIVVTLRCEHSCPYCQVSRQSDDKFLYDMPPEIADKSLEFIFRSPSPAIKIEFQGGEPLLNFPLIQYIVEKATILNEQHKRDLRFVIATNLALLTDDILDYCRKYKIILSTSLDGPHELHNKNRPRKGNNSYDLAVSGIRKIRETLGADSVSALMTTTNESLDYPIEIIDEYIKQGFSGVFLRPLSPYGFAVKTKSYDAYDVERWLDFYFKGLDYIINLNLDGFRFSEYYASIILKKMLTPFATGYVDLMSPAGIGIAGVIYNYNGDVCSSDEGRMLSEMGDKTFVLGNLKNNSYEEVFTSDALLNPLDESFAMSVPMCNECAFEPYCGSSPVFHQATQGDFVGLKTTSQFCKRNMAIFKKLITLMNTNDEIKRVFLSWIQ